MEGLDSNHIAGILYILKDEVLVLYKKNGEVDIPKGHIQLAETPMEGVKRELAEEAGIILNVDPTFIGKTNVEPGKDLHMFVQQTNQYIKPKVSSEHTGFDFISIDEVTEDFFWSPVQKFFNKIMEKRNEAS